jgi:outer membrane receptor protein involved in Fe transport
MTIRLLTFFVLMSFTKLNAQDRQIVLRNKENRLPVQGASVHTNDYSFSQISDELGRVDIRNVSDSLTISCVGYLPLRIAAYGTERTILLEPGTTTLAEVEVRSSNRAGIFHSISSFDIHLRPIVNSQEVLRLVPGLFIGQHAGGGKAEQIFLRGFDIDHGTDIRIDVDGMPVNMVSHAHGQGYADLHFVIPELIERVNFNKGPYFADRGNFSTAGYIDFRTRDYLNRSFVKLEAGQYKTGRLVSGINLLSEKMRQRNQSLYWASELSYTDGFFDSPQRFHRINSMLKYHGQISPRSSLSSYISAFSSKWYASGQIPDRAVDNGSIGWFGAIDDREGGNTSRYNFNLQLHTRFDNGMNWKNQVYLSRYAFELYSNFTFFLNNPVNGDEIRQKENRWLTGGLSELSRSHELGRLNGEWKAGIQWRADATSNSELSNTEKRETTVDRIKLGDIAEQNFSIFAEERLQLSSDWLLTLGLRGDYFRNRYCDDLQQTTSNSSSTIWSPKLNLNYTVNERVQLYLYTGQSFHSNDTRVAVLQNGRRVVTPAYGADLGGIFKLAPGTLLQSAIWYLWMQQEFVYVGDAGVVEPGGRTRRMGWDLSLRQQIASSWYADVDVNLTHPRALGVPKEEAYLPLAPTFTSSGGISYKKQKGWNGSLRYRAMGNRPADETNEVVARGYLICDAAVNYTQSRWEAGLSVQNLFNTRWKETQFLTESRLQGEPQPVNEIHFTPGVPFFARASFTLFF